MDSSLENAEESILLVRFRCEDLMGGVQRIKDYSDLVRCGHRVGEPLAQVCYAVDE